MGKVTENFEYQPNDILDGALCLYCPECYGHNIIAYSEVCVTHWNFVVTLKFFQYVSASL